MKGQKRVGSKVTVFVFLRLLCNAADIPGKCGNPYTLTVGNGKGGVGFHPYLDGLSSWVSYVKVDPQKPEMED